MQQLGRRGSRYRPPSAIYCFLFLIRVFLFTLRHERDHVRIVLSKQAPINIPSLSVSHCQPLFVTSKQIHTLPSLSDKTHPSSIAMTPQSGPTISSDTTYKVYTPLFKFPKTEVQTTSNATFHPFSRLPTELRMNIWAQAVCDEMEIETMDANGSDRPAIQI